MVVRWDDVRGTWVRYPHTSTIEHTFYKTVESKSMTFFFYIKCQTSKLAEIQCTKSQITKHWSQVHPTHSKFNDSADFLTLLNSIIFLITISRSQFNRISHKSKSIQ